MIIEAMPRPVGPGALRWRIAVNNPTDRDITATFRQAMNVPGLAFRTQKCTIPAGGYRVLYQ